VRRRERRRTQAISPLPLEPAGAGFVPIGHLEYVIEGRHIGRTGRWLVVRPHAAHAVDLESEDAVRLRRMIVVVQIAEPTTTTVPPAPLPAGFNPYFDIPPT